MNFAEQRKKAEQAGLLSSGDYLKLKEGQNRMRLMSECLPHRDEFNGKVNFKWLCYVLDRRDTKVKAFFMPHTIYKALEAFQSSEDFYFDDVPMPYDITVHAEKAGTMDAKYTVMPGKAKDLTEAEVEMLVAMKPLADLQAALKEKKQKDKEKEAPADTRNHKARQTAPLDEDEDDAGLCEKCHEPVQVCECPPF